MERVINFNGNDIDLNLGNKATFGKFRSTAGEPGPVNRLAHGAFST